MDILSNGDINFAQAYDRKIKYIKDAKIAEFNYKVLHLILPCNHNLKKWGKSETDLCNICGTREDIIHLLFHCEHAQRIWQIASHSLNQQITETILVLGNDNHSTNYVISVLAYLIYKEWLINMQDNKIRSWEVTLRFLKRELKFRCYLLEYAKKWETLQSMKDLLLLF